MEEKNLDDFFYYKKSEHCSCVFSSLYLPVNGTDKLMSSNIPYLCDECFAKLNYDDFLKMEPSEKAVISKNTDSNFKKRIHEHEEIIKNIPKNNLMKKEDLDAYFANNSLNKEKMDDNSRKMTFQSINLSSVKPWLG